MKIAVIQTELDKRILEKIEHLRSLSRWEWIKKEVSDLPLQRIQEIAANVFLVNPAELLGKIDHTNKSGKIYKLAFYAGMCFFSNKDSSDCRDFTGTRCNCFYSSDDSILRILKTDKKYAPVVYDYFKALWKTCPNRIKRLTEVNLEMLNEGCVSDWSKTVKLTTYQIQKIPLKELAWFYNNNKGYSMLCFNPERDHECKYINFNRTSDHLLFFALQTQGYKFIRVDDHWDYRKYNPICDRCLHANNCDAKKGCQFGGFGSKKFECFETLPESSLKVDLQLLLPLKHYQLQ